MPLDDPAEEQPGKAEQQGQAAGLTDGAAVEAQGWDGQWYLRAYADDGRVLGGQASRCCRIDAISQAWAVLAGLDPARCRSAMNTAWNELVDENLGVIKLLTPPFDGMDFDPGYIAAYPPGIRENGAQYTHAACWLALALVRMGDAQRAHRAIQMLLPLNHADSMDKARVYRAEPYVMTADIYTDGMHAGRGGWSWYTGAAAWMLRVVYYELMGLEIRADRVWLRAQLPAGWEEASVVLRKGASEYTLTACRGCAQVTLDGQPVDQVRLLDDGRPHVARFPAAGQAG